MTDLSDLRDLADGAVVHATCIVHAGRGALICGASGSGKSGLALQLMAVGAKLVADDRVVLERCGAALMARCPSSIHGLIEARGMGLLHVADTADTAEIAIVVDLDRVARQRMPHVQKIPVLGVEVDLLLRVDAPYFAAAVLHYLAGGGRA